MQNDLLNLTSMHTYDEIGNNDYNNHDCYGGEREKKPDIYDEEEKRTRIGTRKKEDDVDMDMVVAAPDNEGKNVK